MKLNENKIILKTMIVFFLFFGLNVNIFPYIMGNWPPFDDCKKLENKTIIHNSVIEGCGYFLTAYSDILILLNRIELSGLQGIDYDELQKIVDNAASNMNNAKTSYSALVELAASAPYIPGSIQKLKDFDYKSFQVEHRLNGSIFADVVSHLEKGDVKGIYYKIRVNIDSILRQIYAIKADIDLEIFPEIPALWKLNQECSATMLFGQYAAEIFFNIR